MLSFFLTRESYIERTAVKNNQRMMTIFFLMVQKNDFNIEGELNHYHSAHNL